MQAPLCLGVSYLHFSTVKLRERFSALSLPGFPNKQIFVSKLFEDSKRRIWVLSEKGSLYIIAKDRHSFRNTYYQEYNGGPTRFFDITESPEGYFYLASGSGLIVMNADMEIVKSNLSDNLRTNYFFRTVSFFNDSLLWLGSNTGLLLAEIEKYDNLPYIKPVDTLLQGKRIYDILIDHNGNVWAGMDFEGLNKITYKEREYMVQSFKNDP